jgi:ribonuclease HI
MSGKLIVNTDGGARGNPGPAACAFVIKKDGQMIFKDSKFLGTTTNNQAEYQGVIMALSYLSENPKNFSDSEIVFILDSELVARQLAGEYKTKNKDLKNLLAVAKTLEKKLKAKISYTVTSREKNKSADFLVNKKLDEKIKISRHPRI